MTVREPARPDQVSDCTAAWFDRIFGRSRAEPESRLVRFAVDRACRSHCDFACGTGTLLKATADQGLVIAGCDRSPRMIRLARERTGLHDRRQLAVRDMRTYRPPWAVDLATCLFDSINCLLTIEDWRSFLANAAACLASRGFLVFDFVTQYDLRECWPGHREVIEVDDLVCVRTASFDRTTGLGVERVTWFCPTDEGWRETREAHWHASFPAELVLDVVEGCGLELVDVCDGESMLPVTGESQRIQITATRR